MKSGRSRFKKGTIDFIGGSKGARTALYVFDEHNFQVFASWACEGSEIESRFTRLDMRKIHLPGAFWAPRAIVHDRGFRRVFELWHVQLQPQQAGVLQNSQPPAPGTWPLPVISDRAPIVNK